MRDVRRAFREQGKACSDLGSPFMERLMRLIADRLEPGHPVADHVLGWAGDVSSSAQSVPLRLAGALHALKRAGCSGLEATYPPAEVSDEVLWNAVDVALRTRAAEVLAFLDNPPQTNEVRRSAALIPALHLLVARFGLPIRLSELGCSAGLNLRADHFLLKASGVSYGPPGAAVRLGPNWSGNAPPPSDLQVCARAGVDLKPVDPDRDVDRLFAYLWPDQPERLALTAAAIETAKAHPAEISASDAADWLEKALAEPREGTAHVVFHTVAWQYFPTEAQARGEAALAEAGRQATEAAPLARFAMEADGGRGAGVTLQIWPGGDTLALGRADFHGRWIDWSVECLDR